MRGIRWAVRILLASGMALAVGTIPARLLGGGGIQRARRLSEDLERLQAEVEEQRRVNAKLREEADALRDDPAAIERVSRDQLGLVREGEIVFQFE